MNKAATQSSSLTMDVTKHIKGSPAILSTVYYVKNEDVKERNKDNMLSEGDLITTERELKQIFVTGEVPFEVLKKLELSETPEEKVLVTKEPLTDTEFKNVFPGLSKSNDNSPVTIALTIDKSNGTIQIAFKEGESSKWHFSYSLSNINSTVLPDR